MNRNRLFISIVILMLCISVSGCAALQRKFVRKKKKKEKDAAIVTAYDYSKGLRVDELYGRHFLFWQSWHTELIGKIDGTYKKRSACFGYIISSLKDMKKYLNSPKDEELEKVIEELHSIGPDIRKQRLTKSQKYKIRKFLEKTKRHIDKNFSYTDVKGFLSKAVSDP